MDVSKGYRALALIKGRFGQHVDPDTAFKLIDHTLRTGHATNVGLKQVICAAAFDRGTLLGILESTDTGTPAGSAFTAEARRFLELPLVADEPTVETPEAEPSRIITP
jgi:hypothetical protein